MKNVNYKQFRQDYMNAVKQLEAKYGVKCSIGTITCDNAEFRFKTVMSDVNLGKQEVIEIKGGLSEYIGKKLLMKGKTYTVVNFKPRNYKMPYIIEDQKGKRFKVSESLVKTYTTK